VLSARHWSGAKREKAVYWYTKAAEQGYADAYAALVAQDDFDVTFIESFITDLAYAGASDLASDLIYTSLFGEDYARQGPSHVERLLTDLAINTAYDFIDEMFR